MLRLCLLALFTSTVVGCAIGGHHAYNSVQPRLPSAPSVSCSLAAAVHDQRAEVRSGDKEPNFVGLSRGGYGNPFDVRTEGKGPLADDVSTVLTRSLQAAGYRVQPVTVSHVDTPEQVTRKLLQTGASCLLSLVIRRLKSDTYQNTAFDYDLELSVLDRAGKLRARALQQGRDNLGGSFWNPPAHARREVPRAFERKLEQLLNDPAIMKALRKQPAGRPADHS